MNMKTNPVRNYLIALISMLLPAGLLGCQALISVPDADQEATRIADLSETPFQFPPTWTDAPPGAATQTPTLIPTRTPQPTGTALPTVPASPTIFPDIALVSNSEYPDTGSDLLMVRGSQVLRWSTSTGELVEFGDRDSI